MAVFRELSANDIKTQRSFLTQLVDVIQEDVSSSATRRKYQVFVTGGIGPGVTSSLFQTVYDQDFTLQTANAMFDITVGLHETGSHVQDQVQGTDSAGKMLFRSSSLMMREKISIYKQFALSLLGDASAQFVAPFNSFNNSDGINAAMFIAFKRLFARDQVKRETFAMRFWKSAWPIAGHDSPNIQYNEAREEAIFTDAGSTANKIVTYGGQVSNIVNAAYTTDTVGLMFNDMGIAVFDLEKVALGTQKMRGHIAAVTTNSSGSLPGEHIMGGAFSENPNATFVPDLLVSASIDDIVDHICAVRFSSGSFSAMAFQNVTNINSTLVYCRASADEFNYSSNPTYIDSSNRIVVIDEGQEDTQQAFTFITGIGLYDSNDNLLCVAKVSRPIEKNNEKDITLRIRIDFAKKNSIHFTTKSQEMYQPHAGA